MTRNTLRSVVVAVPVEVAFAAWADFPAYPAFMPHVHEVRLGDNGTTVHWHVTRDGRACAFTAEVLEVTANRRIVWHTASPQNSTVVLTFRALSAGHTHVTLGAEYHIDPRRPDPTPVRFERNLAGFKAYIEAKTPSAA
jgi:uncharacterized membrane protein